MIEQRINKIKLKLKPRQAYFAFSYENPLRAVDTFYLSGFASSFAGILIGQNFSCYITHDLYFNDVKTKLGLRKNFQPSGSARPVKTSFSSFNEATASPQQDKTTFSSPGIETWRITIFV